MGGHLALVLPGGGLGQAAAWVAPVLIPSLALEQMGARVEVVPYPAFRPDGLDLEAARDFDGIVAGNVSRLLESAAGYERVTFVAKSRGTLFLAAMDPSRVECDRVDAIWLTPLLGLDYVRDGAMAKGWPSLLVAGSADPYHDADAHEAVRAAIGARSLVIDGGDHGLTVEGDVRRTVRAYADLAEAVLDFAG